MHNQVHRRRFFHRFPRKIHVEFAWNGFIARLFLLPSPSFLFFDILPFFYSLHVVRNTRLILREFIYARNRLGFE